jgi:hypothetical protein
VRYIDTGARDPGDALGVWLEEVLAQTSQLGALRWQSGFFGANSLGYFIPAMERLRDASGTLRVLVGSNDGTTARSDVESLLLAAGPPRPNQHLGVVSFDNAYFHPKTVHLERADGSSAAYVGSANLTSSGVASLHVEAGLLLDTNEGDSPSVLSDIAAAIDWWFDESPPGLHLVQSSTDLDHLVEIGVLNVPRPVLPPRPASAQQAMKKTAGEAQLKPLMGIPPLPAGIKAWPQPTIVAVPQAPAAVVPVTKPQAKHTVQPDQWDKPLTRSDAQRKATGNQRGSITLVAAGHPIDPQTYFRRSFFASARWVSGTTRTGQTLEIALVPFEAEILGRKLGTVDLEVTYAPNREASQANYTSLLHLGALAPHFVRQDLTGRRLVLDRRKDGSYGLSIS